MPSPPSDDGAPDPLWTLTDLRRIRTQVDEQFNALRDAKDDSDEDSGAGDSSSNEETDSENDGNEEDIRGPPE